MRIKNQKDFWAGVMFVLFGIFFAGFGMTYKVGNAAQMGPGYFPTALGVVLILLGLAVAIGGISAGAQEEKVDKFAWSTLALILGPVFMFGVLLQPLGLIACLFMLICVSSYASHEFNWKSTLMSAVVLIALCMFVFVYALKLQFQLWPAFIAS
jgi:uncharacterized membrane protein HdeD (DUF308 family)